MRRLYVGAWIMGASLSAATAAFGETSIQVTPALELSGPSCAFEREGPGCTLKFSDAVYVTAGFRPNQGEVRCEQLTDVLLDHPTPMKLQGTPKSCGASRGFTSIETRLEARAWKPMALNAIGADKMSQCSKFGLAAPFETTIPLVFRIKGTRANKPDQVVELGSATVQQRVIVRCEPRVIKTSAVPTSKPSGLPQTKQITPQLRAMPLSR